MTHWIALLALCAAGPALAQEPPPEAGPTETAAEPDATEATPEADTGEAGAAEGADGEGAAPAPAFEASAEFDALKAQLADQASQLAEQQVAIEDLNTQLQQTKLKLIPPDTIQFGIEGHYRLRGHIFNHLYASQTKPNGNYIGDARYMSQRLWLRPTFDYKGLAKAFVEVRALDGLLGDNVSNSSTALFAETPSSTGLDGQENNSIEVSRAWLEFSIPVGLLRVGRQPSQWGMGLLANDGESFDHHFGESHYSSTNDRILFATKPIAIFEKITGRKDSETPFYTVVAVDRLVEDPLIDYYGFKCSPGQVRGTDADYDPRCDDDGDGVTDADHSYTNDNRTTDQRPSDWWADQNDDVWEMVYVAVYRGEDVKYFGGTGDLTAGVWAVHRKQQETASNALIVDAYVSSKVRGTIFEFEGIRIGGKSSAIALPGSTNEGAADPLAKNVDIWGYVGRAGFEQPGWKLLFEHGYASGDEAVADDMFTGRPLNPDHNVGLLLYEEVISRVTQTLWTESGQGLWSKGGVYNSRYVFPTAHVYPLDNWELIGGFVTAWPDKPDGAIIQCKDSDKVECATPASQQATADALGWEVDFAIKHRWHEHLLLALETGFAHATDRLPLENVGLNPEGKFYTFQSRIAYEF